MASAQQPRLWIQRSVVHKDKFQRLQCMPLGEACKQIGGYIVCRQDQFKVAQPSRDGTCVYVGLRVSDGKEVAVKCMLADICDDLAFNETQIFNMIKMEKSPHVVRYRDYLKEDPFIYIILELCEYSLAQYVRRAPGIDLPVLDPQKMIKEILTGLDILHKRGHDNKEMILHRDLKPDNVLIDVEGCIRLADFGVSKKVGEGRSTSYTSSKGNAEWQAAESIPIDGENQSVVYKRKSDIQVVGMLVYYVLTNGRHPFGDISYERPNNIYRGNPVSLEANTVISDVEKDLVSWLIEKNIDDRPYAYEALKHPYLMSIEDQFDFLTAVGNEPEVANDENCDVVNELNNHSRFYPNGWRQQIDPIVISSMSKHPKQYNSNNITRLLRFLRNVKGHINDTRTPPIVRQTIGDPAHYFLDRSRFATLPMIVHKVLRNQAKVVARRGGEAWVNRSTLQPFF